MLAPIHVGACQGYTVCDEGHHHHLVCGSCRFGGGRAAGRTLRHFGGYGTWRTYAPRAPPPSQTPNSRAESKNTGTNDSSWSTAPLTGVRIPMPFGPTAPH